MFVHDNIYLNLLQRLVNKAEQSSVRPDRTGTGTVSIFGPQLEFDLNEGFPLLTTKKIHTKSIIHELLWFLRGDTNIKYLNDNGVSIWDSWADKDGDLGPVYGAQWRKWTGVDHYDQIATLMNNLRTDPYSRRHIVSAWNVEDLPNPKMTAQDNVAMGLMALPPCHTLWQVFIDHETKAVNLKLYQRSADYFLGVPFNIASYALLTHMIARVLGRKVGSLIITFGDCHLYRNHLEQAKEQLTRIPRQSPTLGIKSIPDRLWDFQYDDFVIEGYSPHPAIKAPISI